MQKQTHPFLKIILLFAILGLLACQLDSLMSTNAPTATPTRAATSTRMPLPTETIAVSVLPTQPSTPTDTLAPIVATITTDNLRVRSTPSTSGAIVDKLNKGDKIPVVGKNAAGDWLQIPLPSNPNSRGWISAAFAQLSGSLDGVPVVPPGSVPPTRPPYP